MRKATLTGLFITLFTFSISTNFVQAQQLGLTEEQIDQAYRNYWSKPVENWDAIAQSRYKEVYSIVKGDTLSELSLLFFGTENYWPKIWSLNSYIKNPHLIYVGNEVLFFTGSAITGKPPTVEFEIDPVDAMEQKTMAYSIDDREVKIPPVPAYKPVMRNLPGSFPPWVPKSPAGKDGIVAINRSKAPIDSAEMRYTLNSFVASGASVDRRGYVRGFRNVQAVTNSTFNTIYVSSRRQGSLKIGETYSVIEDKGGVQTRNGKPFLGVSLYEYVGEVKIVRNIRNRLFEAFVTHATNLIPENAILIPGRIPQYNLEYDPEEIKPANAQLLRGNQVFGHNIYGIGQVVYLTSGRNQGMTEGMVVRVNEDRYYRNPEATVVSVLNPVGVIKIVNTLPNFSTGIVVSLADFIVPGDKTAR